MAKLRKEKVVAEHGELGRSFLRWREDQVGASLQSYGLRYAAYHLRWTGEPELLWGLLSDQEYQTEQMSLFQGWVAPAVSSLRWLMLLGGETVQEARTSLQPIFEEFRLAALGDPQRVEDALQRLKILEKSGFFLAGLLLLFIECVRSKEARVGSSRGVAELQGDQYERIDNDYAAIRISLRWFWNPF